MNKVTLSLLMGLLSVLLVMSVKAQSINDKCPEPLVVVKNISSAEKTSFNKKIGEYINKFNVLSNMWGKKYPVPQDLTSVITKLTEAKQNLADRNEKLCLTDLKKFIISLPRLHSGYVNIHDCMVKAKTKTPEEMKTAYQTCSTQEKTKLASELSPDEKKQINTQLKKYYDDFSALKINWIKNIVKVEADKKDKRYVFLETKIKKLEYMINGLNSVKPLSLDEYREIIKESSWQLKLMNSIYNCVKDGDAETPKQCQTLAEEKYGKSYTAYVATAGIITDEEKSKLNKEFDAYYNKFSRLFSNWKKLGFIPEHLNELFKSIKKDKASLNSIDPKSVEYYQDVIKALGKSYRMGNSIYNCMKKTKGTLEQCKSRIESGKDGFGITPKKKRQFNKKINKAKKRLSKLKKRWKRKLRSVPAELDASIQMLKKNQQSLNSQNPEPLKHYQELIDNLPKGIKVFQYTFRCMKKKKTYEQCHKLAVDKFFK